VAYSALHLAENWALRDDYHRGARPFVARYRPNHVETRVARDDFRRADGL
jgi:hypothetical protein